MVDSNPIIKGETIEKIYDQYRRGLYLVNRKYQRKLVWTIEEKTNFIETISKGLPVPLFLFAQSTYLGQSVFEIIDGMQRLNAIISFVENQFPLNGHYFNLDANASIKLLKDKNIIPQKTPVQDNTISAIIASYQIPISTTAFNEEDKIEDSFKRINSNGKHLSRQELRQVGVENNFSKLVRDLSEEIRGDHSRTNFIPLKEMSKYSLSNTDLGYGIKMRDIYWVKDNIITINNMRESKDEELISHILVAILSDNKLSHSQRTLDEVYGFGDDPYNNSKLIEESIRKRQYENIKTQFEIVYQEIKKISMYSKTKFGNLVFEKDFSHISRVYFLVFMAFYDLIINKDLKIENYNDIAIKLKDCGNQIYHDSDISNFNNRMRIINMIKSVIQDSFTKRTGYDPIMGNWTSKIDNLVSEATGEGTNYDFKIGFHEMKEDKFEKPDYDTAITTLLSIANIGRESVGYVIIGIADKESAAKRHREFFGSSPNQLREYYVAGIDSEAIKSCGSVDKYRQKFEQYIKNADIKPLFYKDYILSNMQFAPYYDKTLIVIQIKGGDSPAVYKGEYYKRFGVRTDKVPDDPSAMKELFRGFM